MERSIFKTAIMMMVIFFLLAGTAFGALSLSQIANRHYQSVVKIISLDENARILSTGNGFFINKEGDIATNRHLFLGCDKAVVETWDGQKGNIIEIIRWEPELDLVIARTSLRGTVPPHLGDSDGITIGGDVLSIGTNRGLGMAVTLGNIDGVRVMDGMDLIQITIPLSSGSSGAPVFDAAGSVIGIATAFLDVGKGFFFAIPINDLKKLKPTSIQPKAVTGTNIGMKAVLKGDTLIRIFSTNSETSSYGYTGGEERQNQARVKRNFPARGTIYFKNGKRLVCERAWRQGGTILLQVQGRKIVVGYDEKEIDMERSFRIQGG